MPNGKVLDIEISVVPQFGAWGDIAQLIVENWAEVGIKAHVEIRKEVNISRCVLPMNLWQKFGTKIRQASRLVVSPSLTQEVILP